MIANEETNIEAIIKEVEDAIEYNISTVAIIVIGILIDHTEENFYATNTIR